MNNDTIALQQMRRALEDLEDKFMDGDFATRSAIEPELVDLSGKYASFRLKLLQNGITITDEDLQEMKDIRDAIRSAADKQSLISAIARTAFFIAGRI